jgi:hypothetical protein
MPRSYDVASDESLPQSERLQALSPEEYELLWGHPAFSDSDRALFFQLNSREQEHLGQLRLPWCGKPKNRNNFSKPNAEPGPSPELAGWRQVDRAVGCFRVKNPRASCAATVPAIGIKDILDGLAP